MSDDSKAKKAKITEEHRAEARRLKAIWDAAKGRRRSQAEFGDAYGLGNQSNVGHYLNARSPLNLKAASAFAAELNCSVKDFSPRIALEMGQLRMGDSVAEHGTGGAGIKAGGSNSSPKGGKTAPPSPGHTEGVTGSHEGVGDPLQLRGLKKVPVVGEVKGGDDGFLEEFRYPVGHGEGFIEFPTVDPHAYAVRVRGDSMHPRYRAGEFVIVEPSVEPQDGDDVVVICRNGKKLLKQLNWVRDGEIQLLSINNGYAPLTLSTAEVERIHMVGGRARRAALKR